MTRRATLRASDADREQVAERLRHATAEGRLLAEELEQRLEAALSSRTYGELDTLVADLPGAGVDRRGRSALRPWMAPALGLAIAIMVFAVVLLVALFVITGVFAAWMLWALLGWWYFGHKRRYYGARERRSLHACGRWHGSEPRTQVERGSWI